ncbi:MAG: universal stress protein [Chlorobi bacterium]|nr:universal stress protein [Chlorobiota bacterium]
MNLLAAIDFSEITGPVINHTRNLASALRAKVVLLHVIAPATPVLDTETGIDPIVPVADHAGSPEGALPESRAQEQLQKLSAILDAAGLDVSAHIAHNNEVNAIIDAAERFGSDMIVLGSHGHGALYHLLVGSVSEGVVRKASCPVVIVPARRKPQAVPYGAEGTPARQV